MMAWVFGLVWTFKMLPSKQTATSTHGTLGHLLRHLKDQHIQSHRKTKVKNQTIIMAILHKNLHSWSLWHYLPPPIKFMNPPLNLMSTTMVLRHFKNLKIVRTHFLQTTTHLSIKMQGFETSPYLPKSWAVMVNQLVNLAAALIYLMFYTL